MSGTKLKIKNVDKKSDTKALKKELEKFGKLINLELHTDYAIAEYKTTKEALKAVDKIDGKTFEKRTLKARLTGRKRGRSEKSHRHHSHSSRHSNGHNKKEKRPPKEKPVTLRKSGLWDQPPTSAQITSNGIKSLESLVVKMPDGTFANAPTLLGSSAIPAGIQNKVSPGTLDASSDVFNAKKQSRRLVFANLSADQKPEELKQFLTEKIKSKRNVVDSVISVFINPLDKKAYVEFKDDDSAAFALSFNGIKYGGRNLSVARLKKVAAAGISGVGVADSTGAVSRYVPDGPGKIFCAGIPPQLGEPEVKELICTYGPVSSFFLPQESTGISRGFCFFIYQDLSVTQEAIRGLNGIQIGENTLTVKLHSVPDKEDPAETLRRAQEVLLKTAAMDKHEQPSKVLCMMNMVTKEDLKDEIEYKEIFQDIKKECENFGRVREVVIPRPGDDVHSEGVGKVFVKFKNASSARAAKSSLEGRTFDKRTVYVKFFDEKDFDEGRLDKKK